jgi:HEAT repeat protein
VDKRHIRAGRELDIWLNQFPYGELQNIGGWLQHTIPTKWGHPKTEIQQTWSPEGWMQRRITRVPKVLPVKNTRVMLEVKVRNDSGIHTQLVGAEFVPVPGETLEIMIPTSGEMSLNDGRVCAMTAAIAEEAIAALIMAQYLEMPHFDLLPAGKLIFLASGFSSAESRWAKEYLAKHIVSILPFFDINPEERLLADINWVYFYRNMAAKARYYPYQPKAEDLPNFIRAIKDDNPIVREQAAASLSRIPSEDVIPYLIEAVHDKAVIATALRELIKLGKKEAYPAILEEFHKFEEHDQAAQWQLIHAIVAFGGDDAYDLLIGLLDKGLELGELAWNFRQIGDARILPHLWEHSEQEGRWRGSIIRTIGEFGDKRAIPMLSQLLHSDIQQEASDGIRGLAGIGGEEAIKLLLEAYHFPNFDNYLRSNTLTALGEIGKGDERVWDLFIQVCEDAGSKISWHELSHLFNFDAERAEKHYREQLNNPDLSIRLRAARILLDRVNALELRDMVFESLDKVDAETRVSLVWYLCKYDYENILPLALEIIHDETVEAMPRKQLIVQLKHKKAREFVPHLIRLIESKNLEIVRAAIEALGEIGDTAAIPVLIAKLEDYRASLDAYPYGAVYDWAENALYKFNIPEIRYAIDTAFRRRNHLDEYRK